MLPRELLASMPESERALWRVVRLDNFSALEGLIVAAHVEAGTAVMQVRPAADGDNGQVIHSLGPYGIRIVPR